MNNDSQPSPLRLLLLFLLFFVVPAGAGLYLAPRLVATPKVGIIRLNYDIDDVSAFEFREQMAYVREARDVAAVVVILNSPGGAATFSEELYLNILHARRSFPVVASVDVLAASGAYYVAAGANEIYAKPTSYIGSIGVIGLLPGPIYIDDRLVTTGPFKAFGGTEDAAIRQAERSKFAFLEAIRAARGEALDVDLDVLARGEIYDGLQALEMGLIDGILSTDEAIARAAELAGLADYETVELYPLAFPEDAGGPATTATTYQAPQLDFNRLWEAPTGAAPGHYFRYVVPSQ
ncbi:MAG: S49 family peptidase [Anaerolineae bacterium]|nr:S49 family peptidase [Anaerolineae bacterium]